jgi:hypothetical protein
MSNTIQLSTQELGQFLDAVSAAPVALRDVPRINKTLATLVSMANAVGPIVALTAPADTRETEPERV